MAASPVLVVVPHPDDETLACGGLIAKRCADGDPPHVVVATDGALGGRFFRQEDVVPGRRQEFLRALGVLGVPPERIWALGLEDGRLPEQKALLQERLSCLLDRLAPAAVIFTSAWDPHADHAAVGEVMRMLALRRSILAYETLIWGWSSVGEAAAFVRRNRPALPSVVRWMLAESVDVGGYVDLKKRAIAEYQSQLHSSAAAAGVPFDREQLHLVDSGGVVGGGLLRQFLRPQEVYFRAPCC